MIRSLSLFLKERKNYKKFASLPASERRLVFYSEKDIYYQYFEGCIEYILANSEIPVCYLTSDPDDPLLKTTNPRIQPFYLNIFLPAALRFLEARVLVMTMPDLESYHIKRSKNEVNHVYMFHAIGSTHLQYNKNAFQGYDTVLCNGENEIRELREAEKLYGFKKKELVECGYYRAEKIFTDYRDTVKTETSAENNRKTILIAPSWHEGNILESCVSSIIGVLQGTDYNVIIRPHPECIRRNLPVVRAIGKKLAGIKNISMETDMVKRTSILEANFLITDWSAISFEYAFGTERPVIFINTICTIQNKDYREIPIDPLEFTLRNKIGVTVELDNISEIIQILHDFSKDSSRFRDNILEQRGRCLFNWMQSSEAAGKYLIDACK